MSAETIQWTDGSGRLYLELTLNHATSGYHSGRCDEDIAHLYRDESVARQLAGLNPEHVRLALRECGCWSDEELSDHVENLHRILWIACSDIVDGAAA